MGDVGGVLPESEILREMVEKILMHLTVSLTLEKKRHRAWVEANHEDDDSVNVGYLGIGCRETTWYGSPDGRLRGHAKESTVDLLSYDSESESGAESDGATSHLEMKKIIKKCSQTIGTAVLSSFTEHNLHMQANPLVPCILMDCDFVQVVMYDCVNDVLLMTDKVYLRDRHGRITPSSIPFLWLFINHKYIT